MGSVKFSALERDSSTNGKLLRCLFCLCSAQGPGQCLLIGDAALNAPTCIRPAGHGGQQAACSAQVGQNEAQSPLTCIGTHTKRLAAAPFCLQHKELDSFEVFETMKLWTSDLFHKIRL